MRGACPPISFTSTTFQQSSHDHISFALGVWNYFFACFDSLCPPICFPYQLMHEMHTRKLNSSNSVWKLTDSQSVKETTPPNFRIDVKPLRAHFTKNPAEIRTTWFYYSGRKAPNLKMQMGCVFLSSSSCANFLIGLAPLIIITLYARGDHVWAKYNGQMNEERNVDDWSVLYFLDLALWTVCSNAHITYKCIRRLR